MSERKPYLLRLPPDLMDDLMRWAKDDLRSFNGQIEWILRDALRQKRRKALIEATSFLDAPPPRSKREAPRKRPPSDGTTDGNELSDGGCGDPSAS